MAARSTLTVQNLAKLGAKRLAEILITEAGANRQLKQAIQMALAAESGSTEVGHQIRKRLAQIGRSEAFVASEKAKDLGTELERLRSAIVETIGAANPKLAVELLWQLIDLHSSIFERLDDSSGRVGGLFRSACLDLGPLLKRAKTKPGELAPMVLQRIIDNGYGIYDGIVLALSEALGREGRNVLRGLLEERRKAHLVSEKRAAVRPGHFDYTLSGLLVALRDIADCESDVDAFIDTYKGFDLTNPAYASEIAERLLRAGRPKEALLYLDQGAPNERNRRFKELDWGAVRIGVLDALDRKDDAQALRFSLFERHLSAPHLKAYLKQLGDFDDVEAERAALTKMERHSNVHAALAFLINWPALDRAARVVDARIQGIDGDLYDLLDPAASALEGKYPLAAVLLRRRLIDFTLQKARSTRYRHAVRHVREIESQQSDITDYGRHESHADYMSRLKRDHARKPAFWSLLAA
ncbi:MAG: DUF6880 family protein [Hyphomicrobiaceae bacterium]